MQEAVSKNDVQQLSHEYKQTLKTLLNLILAKLKESGRKTNGEINIKVGKDDVYRSVMGQEPTSNRLSKDNIEQIKIALSRPQELKGVVSISVDNELVYSVKNGKIITDLINIVPKPKNLETETTKEDKYLSLARVQMEVNNLEKEVAQEQESLSSLSNESPDLEQELLEIKQAAQEQKETLDQILSELRRIGDSLHTSHNEKQSQTKLKETFGSVFNKIAKVVTPNFTKLQTELNERLSDLGDMVDGFSEKFDNTLQEAKGQEIAKKARELLGYKGDLDEANNSVDFESNQYLFIVKDKILSVSAKDWRGEILNDKGFTTVATEEDIETLEKVPTYLETLKQERPRLRVAGL